MDSPQTPTNFIQSTDAASRYGFTNDHIASLCRRGKVEGQLINGRLWQVNEESLKAYIEQARLEKEARKRQLSEQFKQEHQVRLNAQVPQVIPRAPLLPPELFVFTVRPMLASMLTLTLLFGAVCMAATAAPAPHVAVQKTSIPFRIGYAQAAAVATTPDIIGGTFSAVRDAFVFVQYLPDAMIDTTLKGQEALGSAYWSTADALASSMAPHTSTLAVVKQKPRTVVAMNTPAKPAAPKSVIQKTIIIPAPAPVPSKVSYVTQTQLTMQLQQVTNSLRSFVYSNMASTSTTVSPIPQYIAASGNGVTPYSAGNRITQLDGVTITNSSIDSKSLPDLSGTYLATSGGTISGSVEFSSTTATSTVDGNFKVVGTLEVGAHSAYLSETGLQSAGSSFTISTSGADPGTLALQTLGRVGVSSTTPWGVLSVEHNGANANMPVFVASQQGTSSPFLLVDYMGRVGIGTSSPSDTFALNGAAYLADIGGPAATTNRLYNNGGALYWNGSILATNSGSVSTTTVNTWTMLQTFSAGLLATASSTIGGNLTIVGNSTSTNATTTSFFAATASSTNLFAQTATVGALTANSLVLNSTLATQSGGLGGNFSASTGALSISGGTVSAGTLSIANGGTNATSFANNGLIYYNGTRFTNAYASSTIGDSTQAGGLTINGGATTTGTAYFAGNVGIGTTTPWGQLSVSADTNIGVMPRFVVGSSTITDFFVNSAGGVSVGSTTKIVAGSAFTLTEGNLQVANNFASKGFVDANSGFNIAGIQRMDPNGNLVNLGGTIRGGSGNGLNFETNALSTVQATLNTNGNFGIGTSTPYALLSLLATSTTGVGSPSALFTVASTTGGTATSTLFDIENTGQVAIGTTTNLASGLVITGPAKSINAVVTTSDFPLAVMSNSTASGGSAMIGFFDAAVNSFRGGIGTDGGSGLNFTNRDHQILLNLSRSGVVVTGAGSTNFNAFTVTPSSFSGTSGDFTNTEVKNNLFSGNTVTIGANTALANQRFTQFSQPTITATTTNNSITGLVANVYIAGAPIIAGSATSSLNAALYIDTGTSITTGATNAYGLYVNAPTGATNNYAGIFTGGNVGVGTTSPYANLSIQGTNGQTYPVFVIATSTNTTRPYAVQVDQTGNVTFDNILYFNHPDTSGGTLANISSNTSGSLILANANGNVTITGNNVRFGAAGAGFYGNNNAQVMGFTDVGGSNVDYLGASNTRNNAGYATLTTLGADTNINLNILPKGSGNVGIGSTTPFANLSVFAGGDYAAHAASTLFAIGSSTAGTATSTLFTVTSAGQVGIGTSSPYSALSVQINNANGIGYIMTGTASDASVDNAGGVALVLSHNSSGNRQFSLADSVSGLGVRVAANALDGYNYLTNTRQDLFLGANTTNVGINGTTFKGATGNVGVGSTTPFAQLSVFAGGDYAAHAASTLFAIGSSTAGTATSTLFSVSSAGNVGIGTTSPVATLAVSGNIFSSNGGNAAESVLVGDQAVNGGFPGIWFGANANTPSYTNYAFLYDSAIGTIFNTPNTKAMIFRVANSEKVRIDSSGNLGIGSTSPYALSSIFAGGDYAAHAASTLFAIGSSTAGTATTTLFTLNSNGFVGILTTPESVASASALSINSGIDILGSNVLRFGGSFTLNQVSAITRLSTAVSSTAAIQFTLGSTEYMRLNSSGLGLGTSSPIALLTVGGGNLYPISNGGFLFAVATSTGNATTTAFSIDSNGFVSIGAGTGTTTTLLTPGANISMANSGIFTVDASSSTTTISNLSIGNLTFDTNAGVVNLSDIPIDTNAAQGVVQEQILALAGSTTLAVYGEADGSGGVQNQRVGVATSSPWRTFSVQGTVGFSGLNAITGTNSSLCLDSNGQVVFNNNSDSCASSLRSTKHNITDLTFATTTATTTIQESAVELIQQLQPVSFVYNNDLASTTRYGFIAEDAVAVDPHLGSYDAQGHLSGIEDRSFIALAISAVKELIATVQGFAKSFTTQQLCVADSTGAKTCITKAQLDQLLANSQSGVGSSGGSGSTPSGQTQVASSSPAADITPPTITVTGANPATVSVGATYVDLGATVTDNVNQNLGYQVSVDGGATTTPDQLQIDTTAVGTHTITYQATDAAGNVGYATRTITVADLNVVSFTTATSTP